MLRIGRSRLGIRFLGSRFTAPGRNIDVNRYYVTNNEDDIDNSPPDIENISPHIEPISTNTVELPETPTEQYSGSWFSSVDNLLGTGIQGLANSVNFTSKTLNSTIKTGEEYTSSFIKSSAEVLKSVTPKVVDSDKKILPDAVEHAVDFTVSTSASTTKFVRNSIGTVTGYGATVGAAAYRYLPEINFSSGEGKKQSASLEALRGLAAVTAEAVKDTLDTTDKLTSNLTEAGIEASESLSSHVLGNQTGKILGTSLRAGKDLVDTVQSTRKLNLQKLSVKFTKKARDGLLEEVSKKPKLITDKGVMLEAIPRTDNVSKQSLDQTLQLGDDLPKENHS